MKILIVANHNKNRYSPFVVEQVEALKKLGVEFDFYGVQGKGVLGYLSNLGELKKKIDEYQPDLIHAHYGLSGLLANLQRKIPVLTTYHGSDIHSSSKARFYSRLSILLSTHNIFVTKGLIKLARFHGRHYSIIPCGVETTQHFPMERNEARKKLGWNLEGKYVLFSGAFNNPVKNSPLAIAAVKNLPGVELKEMRGYNREEVNLVMNAANCLLLTSFREGSPMVIKEAMACCTPVVAVKVGDVEETMEKLDGYYITSYDVEDITEKLKHALSFQGKTQGLHRLIEQKKTNEIVSQQILELYKEILSSK